MNTSKRCTRCFSGVVANGVCSRCGHPEQPPGQRISTALPLGATLHNRYYMGDVLGSGGFGITYSAWDRQENRRVAVKELFPNQDVSRMQDRFTVRPVQGQEEYFRHASMCFENEARLLLQLREQPGIIGLYHLFDANGTLYYAMEYLEGMDLRTHLARNGRMSWETLGPLLRPVLDALERLHDANLIHRDISPDNIFLTSGGQTRLIDFGSVRTYKGMKSFTTFIKQNFAPWEQYQTNGMQGPWTDIYALCVTMYYALTGTLPPKAPDRRLKDTAVPLAVLCPQLPKNAADAIQKGMAVGIQERYPDVRQLSQALFPGSAAVPHTAGPVLVCSAGHFQGRRWPLTANIQLQIGRRAGCEIRYPANMRMVSGLQCAVAVDGAGCLMVRDSGSTNGTWLDQTQLRGGLWYRAAQGCRIRFAQEEYVFQ